MSKDNKKTISNIIENDVKRNEVKNMYNQERVKLLTDLNSRPYFKGRFIALHGIDKKGNCTCLKGAMCAAAGKHPIAKSDVKNHNIKSNKEFESIIIEYPDANFAILTGDGLVVIDIDVKGNGLETYEKLKDIMPETFTVRTGTGGLHLYYSTDVEVRNRVRFVDGIDVRGDGGYVVAPTSKHKCGGHYEIIKDIPIQPITPELMELITTPKADTNSDVQNDVELVDAFGEGERHDRMVKIGGTMYRQGLSYEAVLECLQNMNETVCSPPLPYSEIKSIAKSLQKYKNAERNPDLNEPADSKKKLKICYIQINE